MRIRELMKGGVWWKNAGPPKQIHPQEMEGLQVQRLNLPRRDWLREHTILISLILAAGGLYVLLLPRFDIGFYNDDASFVLASLSLLKAHYVSLALPHQPPASFPMPGLPLLLAPFVQFVKPHWSLLEGLSVVVTLASGILFWKLFRRWLSPGARAVALALFLFNPTTAHFSGMLMSEPYYSLFTLLSFLSLDKLSRGRGNLKPNGALRFMLPGDRSCAPKGLCWRWASR